MPAFSRPSCTSGSSSVSSIATALPSASLPHERDVDDADRARLDEIRDRRCDLSSEAVPGKAHDRVIDRSDFFHPLTPLPYDAASAFCLIASNSACVIAPESSRPFAFSISDAALPVAATVLT